MTYTTYGMGMQLSKSSNTFVCVFKVPGVVNATSSITAVHSLVVRFPFQVIVGWGLELLRLMAVGWVGMDVGNALPSLHNDCMCVYTRVYMCMCQVHVNVCI